METDCDGRKYICYSSDDGDNNVKYWTLTIGCICSNDCQSSNVRDMG